MSGLARDESAKSLMIASILRERFGSSALMDGRSTWMDGATGDYGRKNAENLAA